MMCTTMEEVWRTWKETEVSSFGRFRVRHTGVAYWPRVDQYSGYAHVVILGKRYKAHLVVAAAFLPIRPSENHTIDHKDRNKGNNRIDNLRWATWSEQMLNRKSTLNRADSRPVEVNFGEGWTQCDSVNEAIRTYGFNAGSLGRVLRGNWPRVNGAAVRYVNTNKDDFENEVWKIVDGHPISNRGRVKSNRWKSPAYTPVPIQAGYCKAFGRYVHQLVMQGFGPPRPLGEHTIDHINRIRNDNRIENLRWATWETQNGNRAPKKRTASALYRPVRVTMKNGEIAVFSSAAEAQQATGVDSRRVSEAANGKAWNKADPHTNKCTGIRFDWHNLTLIDDLNLPRKQSEDRAWLLPSDDEEGDERDRAWLLPSDDEEGDERV